MVWTSPMTAVSNTALTAVQWNTFVRDNMLETAAGKATQTGSIFVGTGTNSLVERLPAGATVTTDQATSSSSFADLATVGPSVEVDTGTSAIISIQATMDQVSADSGTSGGSNTASYAVSGATTISASVEWRICRDGMSADNPIRYGITHFRDDLNPGTNTFTMKYLIGSTKGHFSYRHIVVIPL